MTEPVVEALAMLAPAPAGYDSSDYEDYSDEDLAEEVSFLKTHLSHYEDMLDSGEYDYDEYLEDQISALKDELALINAGITWRLPVKAPVELPVDVVAKAEPNSAPHLWPSVTIPIAVGRSRRASKRSG